MINSLKLTSGNVKRSQSSSVAGQDKSFIRLFLPKLVEYQFCLVPMSNFEPHNVVSDKLGSSVIVLGRLYKTLVVFVNVDDVEF